MRSDGAKSEVDFLAKKIWDYHLMHHKLEKADCLLILSSNDLRVAEYAATLFLDGWAPFIVFSGTGAGHKGDLLATGWKRAEADVFAKLAMERGVEADKILIENKSMNTGENIKFSRALLLEKGLYPKKVILVQKPYMERRTYATMEKIWPEVAAIVTSPPLAFDEYPTSEITQEKLVNIMVGDLQRIMEYPARGFQAPQDVPEDVRLAYERLVQMGYTKHLIPQSSLES